MEAALLIPMSSGEDGVGGLITPVVSYVWHGITAHLSANAIWTPRHEPAFTGSWILEGPDLLPGLHPGFEATTGWERHAGRAWSVSPALLWSPRENLTFDVGYLFGRLFGATAHEIRAGVTWSFEAWGDGSGSR